MIPDHIRFIGELLDSEMDRFWIRFNIFSAVQVAALIGSFLSNAKLLKHNKPVARAALVVMLVFSLVGVIVTYRGFDLQRAMVKSVTELELVAPADGRVAEYIFKHTQLFVHVNTVTCIGFTCFCLFFWAFVLIWLEFMGGYEKIVIPKDEKATSTSDGSSC